jgi:hypothetical protein
MSPYQRFQFLEALLILVRKPACLKRISRNFSSKGWYLKILVMLTYEKICRNPQAALSLIGMSLLEFEKLYAEFELAYRAHANSLAYTRRDRLKRRRAVGGGRKHKYSLRDRLLMTLFWLKAFTTYEVLGALYKLDKTTIEDNLNDVLKILASMRALQLERPPSDIPRVRSLQELMDAFPEARLLLESDQHRLP